MSLARIVWWMAALNCCSPVVGQSSFAVLARTQGPAPHAGGESPHALLVDLDLDRDLDYVSSTLSSPPPTNFRYYSYLGSLAFAAPVSPSPGNIGVPYYSLAAGDCNGDGYPDVLIPQYDFAGVIPPVLLLGGPQGFTDVTSTHLPPGPSDVGKTGSAAFVDVDGDGDLDAVLGTLVANVSSQVLLNDGSGRFQHAPSPTLNDVSGGFVLREIQGADLDGDGDQDLVLGIRGTGASCACLAPKVYMNDGTGRFTPHQFFTTARSNYLVRIGDLDADRDLDLVMFAGEGRAFGTSPPQVWINDGRGNFSDETAQRLPPHAFEEIGCLADFDGDGDLDIVAPMQNLAPTGNGDFDVWTQWVNDGTGHFTAASPDLMPRTAESRYWSGALTAGDIDADGDVDIAVGYFRNYAPHRVEILWNLTRHLYAPAEPHLGDPYEVQVWARPNHAVALLLAFAGARFDFGVFGVLEIDPSVVLPVPPVQMPASGQVSFTFPLSHDPVLLGLDLWWQAIDVDPLGTPRLTAAFHDVVLP